MLKEDQPTEGESKQNFLVNDIRGIRKQYLSYATMQKHMQIISIIIIVRNGKVYILDHEANSILQTVDTLEGIMKIVTSQENENLGALKLNEMVDGYDHIIFKIKQRDEFIQYILEHAQDNQKEIYFESMENF